MNALRAARLLSLCAVAACGNTMTNPPTQDFAVAPDSATGGPDLGGGCSDTACPQDASTGSRCDGGMLCSGSCVDTASDKANCGGCGLTCATTCSAGRCLVQISPDPAGAMIVDGSDVFWNDPSVMQLDSTPITGGTSTLLASTGDTSSIAVDADSVYWQDLGTNNNDGSLHSVPRAGGAGKLLLSSLAAPSTVAGTANGLLYWGDARDGTVLSLPSGGGTAATTVTTGQAMIRSLRIHGTNLYWVAGAVGSEGIYTVALAGGTARALASGEGGASDLGVDDSGVYWVAGSGSFALRTVAIAGGSAHTLATSPAAGASVASDGTTVYWTTAEATTGRVLAVPVAGGTPAILAQSQKLPHGVAVDATSVYWSEGTGGAIWKLTPK